MPRYLALDFVSQILQERKAIQTRMQLTVPQHLESVDAYIHRGVLPDPAYRKPWLRVRPDFQYLQEEGANELSELQQGHFKDGPEYMDGVMLKSRNLGLVEIVPSSNPSSQQSFTDDVIEDIFLNAGKIPGEMELFEKVDLQNVKQQSAYKDSDDTSTWLIEEPLCTEPLRMTLDALPKVGHMLDRLRPKIVKDPFADNTGETYTEASVFRTDRSDIFHTKESSSKPISETPHLDVRVENGSSELKSETTPIGSFTDELFVKEKIFKSEILKNLCHSLVKVFVKLKIFLMCLIILAVQEIK
ncbi:unnamed protein product [Owenia fusiformis]|uniref:Uncharacterized protein n=1 Tax=Owenia fusiformis TaxID=6347 RepID=A0A8S4N5C1_OWEFU|nr:unnamed protein product [Owenia fusiformis]